MDYRFPWEIIFYKPNPYLMGDLQTGLDLRISPFFLSWMSPWRTPKSSTWLINMLDDDPFFIKTNLTIALSLFVLFY